MCLEFCQRLFGGKKCSRVVSSNKYCLPSFALPNIIHLTVGLKALTISFIRKNRRISAKLSIGKSPN